MDTIEKGWGIDITSKKSTHYYVNDISLCKKSIRLKSIQKLQEDDFVPVLGFLCKSCEKKLKQSNTPMLNLTNEIVQAAGKEVYVKLTGEAREIEKNLSSMREFEMQLTEILGEYYVSSDKVDEVDFVLVIMAYESCFNLAIEEGNDKWNDFTTLQELIDWMHGFNPYGYLFLPSYRYESGEKVMYGNEELYYIGKDPFDKKTRAICLKVFEMIREFKSVPLNELKPKN